MAIIPGVPGLEVEVLINEEPVKEYEDEDAEEVPTVSGSVAKYIESQTGAEFSFRCKFSKDSSLQNDDLAIIFSIDGTESVKHLCRKKNLPWEPILKLGHRYWKDDEWFLKKFTFTELNIVEDTEQPDAAKVVKQIFQTGVLNVSVVRVIADPRGKLLNPESHRQNNMRPCDVPEEVSEKALKGRAVTHATSLATAMPIDAVRTASWTYIDNRNVPFLSYNFNYRSLEALQALGIGPRPPSPEPQASLTADLMTAEQRQELAARLAHLQQELNEAQKLLGIGTGHVQVKKEVKRERVVDVDDDDVAVVVGETRTAKRRIIETIDLTDD